MPFCSIRDLLQQKFIDSLQNLKIANLEISEKAVEEKSIIHISKSVVFFL